MISATITNVIDRAGTPHDIDPQTDTCRICGLSRTDLAYGQTKAHETPKLEAQPSKAHFVIDRIMSRFEPDHVMTIPEVRDVLRKFAEML